MNITTIALTVYVLVWPALVAITGAVLARGFFKDWKEAKEAGGTLV